MHKIDQKCIKWSKTSENDQKAKNSQKIIWIAQNDQNGQKW